MNTTFSHPVDLEAFVAGGEKLYQQQRTRLQEEDQAYRWARFKLQQEYEERARKLQNEYDDRLRELDDAHLKTRLEAERMLAAVAALREA